MLWSGHAGAAKVVLEGAAVRAVCALWSGHAGAAGGCCCSSGVRFGVGMLVPVQVAAASCCALAALAAGAAPGCRCRVPLQAAAAGCCFRVLLLELRARPAGAAGRCLAGCGCRILLSKGCLHLRNLGERGVCYEAWVLVSRQGLAARCQWQCWRWALMEITFLP